MAGVAPVFCAELGRVGLLHCWSLSLGEQFYLAWPLLIVAARRYRVGFGAIALASLASLLASVVVSRTDPSAVFFLTPFRIYEFGCGALLLFVEPRMKLGRTAVEIVSGAGIAAVLASILVLRSDLPYPAIASLLPCLGAAATILAGGQTVAARLLLVDRPMMAVGAISYSLYLCHWPIIFFARFIVGDGVETAVGTVGLLASMLVVAGVMHLLVERRFIQVHGQPGLSFARTSAVRRGDAAAGGPDAPDVPQQGLSVAAAGGATGNPASAGFPGNTDLGGTEGPVGVQFLGDSLVGQYAFGLKPVMRELRLDYQVAGGPGCPILYGVTSSNPARREFCRSARDHALEQISRNTLPIVFTQLWRLYDDASIDVDTPEATALPPVKGTYDKLRLALRPTVEALLAQGHRILLIGAQVDPGCPIDQPRLLPGPLPHAPQAPCPAVSRGAIGRADRPDPGWHP